MRIDLDALSTKLHVGETRQEAIDLRLDTTTLGETTNSHQLVTSKFACTPGCGHTGTGNSFCCTCK